MGCIMVREILNHRPRHYRRAVLQGEDRNRIKGGMPIVELSMLGIHQAINFMAILEISRASMFLIKLLLEIFCSVLAFMTSHD
ncbi:uncharacterized protein LOC131063472 isoform X6 [Cryptomeria japonica]|uniref:uncharacterized protein LOC131063472 isoform X6 n=1 Tax=Cryptomeria japonica TaxID=3369 RepID=UPI0025AD3323|nr:uncharacterized protein LOC131063472 isoform X6 [Cryptomeria japonica]